MSKEVVSTNGDIEATSNRGTANGPAVPRYIIPHMRKRMQEEAEKQSQSGTNGRYQHNNRSNNHGTNYNNGGGNNSKNGYNSNGRNYNKSFFSKGYNGNRNVQYSSNTRLRRPFPDAETGLCSPDTINESELFRNHRNTGINFDKYNEIPVDAFGQDVPPPCQRFSELDLHPVLKNAIGLCGYEVPTPVQQNSLPIILAGRDLMACAQTGSGKTAAFLFPTIGKLLQNQEKLPSWDTTARPSALILAPTRELALQIYGEARKFTYRSVLRPVVVYGGSESYHAQRQDLRSGCDILVACPGRLIDMIKQGYVSLSNCHFLCLDEADRMLDMGFEDSIRQIVDFYGMPKGDDRQTLMFSATFPKEIQQLATDFLNRYVFLKVGRVGSTTEFIKQHILFVEEKNKIEKLFDTINSIEGLTLIFVETKRQVDELHDILSSQGYPCTSIHGDRNQADREEALEEFKSARSPILVATDVAARGLDISNVAHVINFDMPKMIEDYVHRIGRTGRAGNVGIATGFFNDRNLGISKDLVKLLKEANQEVPNWLANKESEASRLSYNRGRNNHSYGNRYKTNDHGNGAKSSAGSKWF